MGDAHAADMRLDDILDMVSGYASDADTDLIIRAYFFAARAHDKQERQSGEAYLTHPLAVAGLLAELQMDVDTIATALLHDTLEDTFATPEELERLQQLEAEAVANKDYRRAALLCDTVAALRPKPRLSLGNCALCPTVPHH